MLKEYTPRRDYSNNPDNPYLFILTKTTAQTKKGRAAQFVNCFSSPDRFPKQVVPANDLQTLEEKILTEIREGITSVGITTCYKEFLIGGVVPQGRPLTAPWWVGIRTEDDLHDFLHGNPSSDEEYLKKGYLYYLQQNRKPIETIVITNPWKYGQDRKRNFVSRMRVLPQGGFYGEMTLGTLSLRDLEGRVEGKNLIRVEINPGQLKVNISIGENYQNDLTIQTLVKNIVGEMFYRWLHEPVCLLDYLEIIKLFGYDTIELIGQSSPRGSVGYLRLSEIR